MGIIVLCFYSISAIDYNAIPVKICPFLSINHALRYPFPDKSTKEITFPDNTVYDWNITVGGTHLENWKTDPSLLNSLLLEGLFFINKKHKISNLEISSKLGYESGAMLLNNWDVRKVNDLFTLNFLLKTDEVPFALSFSSNFRTQILPGYSSSIISKPEKITSFLSPATLLLSYGYSHDFGSDMTGSVLMGICGGKADVFINQSLYDISQSKTLYGVDKGEYFTASYGVNFKCGFDKEFHNNLRWQNATVLFLKEPYEYHKDLLQYTDFEIHNTLYLNTGKVIRTKVESVILYNPVMDKALQFRHSITIGFGR